MNTSDDLKIERVRAWCDVVIESFHALYLVRVFNSAIGDSCSNCLEFPRVLMTRWFTESLRQTWSWKKNAWDLAVIKRSALSMTFETTAEREKKLYWMFVAAQNERSVEWSVVGERLGVRYTNSPSSVLCLYTKRKKNSLKAEKV